MDSLHQVKYWLGSVASDDKDKAGDDKGTYLDYHVFLGLSVIGGFFGLDHLYLRSPVTFLAKFIVNIFCFGIWWLYDAAQAVFHSDVVKLYGLGIPTWGPFGIGAGVLTREEPDEKHYRFLLYALALFFGGFIGLDSFVLGNRQTGIIRLLCAVSVMFVPVAIMWWAYGLFQFFTNTEELVNQNHEFFGAPKYSVSDKMRARFPLLGLLFSPMETIKTIVNNIVGPSLLAPVTQSIASVVGTVEKTVSTVDNTVQFGREVVQKSGEIMDQIGKTVETVSQASTIMPAASLYASAQEGLKAVTQSGGALAPTALPALPEESLNRTPFLLLVLIGIVALSGYAVTWYRSRSRHVQREKPTDVSRDDTPPQPGVL